MSFVAPTGEQGVLFFSGRGWGFRVLGIYMFSLKGTVFRFVLSAQDAGSTRAQSSVQIFR